MRKYPYSNRDGRVGLWLSGCIVALFGMLIGVVLVVAQVPLLPGKHDSAFKKGKVVRDLKVKSVLAKLVDCGKRKIKVDERVVNFWIKEGLKLPKLVDSKELKIHLQEPNVRIYDDQVQVSFPLKILYLRKARTVNYVILGRFVVEGREVRFKADEQWVDGAKLPFSLFYGEKSVLSFASIFKDRKRYEAFKEDWSKVKRVEIKGEKLILELG